MSIIAFPWTFSGGEAVSGRLLIGRVPRVEVSSGGLSVRHPAEGH
jgi:hypothetical protein